MKPGVLAAVSFGLNVVLASAFVFSRHPTGFEPAGSSAGAAPAAAAHLAPPSPKPAAPPSPPPCPWSLIESDDYRKYIANLRAVECPEWLVRDIIVAELDDLYQHKLEGLSEDMPPWLGADRRRAQAREHALKRRALQVEKRALVKELLGYEWDSRANEIWNQDAATSLQLGFLSDMKAMQVLSLGEKYHEAEVNVREDAKFILRDDGRARLDEDYYRWVAEMSQLLTPVEWDEYQLRLQALRFITARDIHFDGTSLTGLQVRELARLSRTVKDMVKEDFSEEENISGAEEARRQAGFENGLKILLGLKSFAEYQRAQEPDFREIFQFTRQHRLPEAVAVNVYDARRATEAQAAEVRADPTLSPEQKSAALSVLKMVAAKKIQSALGGAGPGYEEGPGQWLEDLTAPANPEPKDQP